MLARADIKLFQSPKGLPSDGRTRQLSGTVNPRIRWFLLSKLGKGGDELEAVSDNGTTEGVEGGLTRGSRSLQSLLWDDRRQNLNGAGKIHAAATGMCRLPAQALNGYARHMALSKLQLSDALSRTPFADSRNWRSSSASRTPRSTEP